MRRLESDPCTKTIGQADRLTSEYLWAESVLIWFSLSLSNGAGQPVSSTDLMRGDVPRLEEDLKRWLSFPGVFVHSDANEPADSSGLPSGSGSATPCALRVLCRLSPRGQLDCELVQETAKAI